MFREASRTVKRAFVVLLWMFGGPSQDSEGNVVWSCCGGLGGPVGQLRGRLWFCWECSGGPVGTITVIFSGAVALFICIYAALTCA